MMRKIFSILTLLLFVVSLASCSGEVVGPSESVGPIVPPSSSEATSTPSTPAEEEQEYTVFVYTESRNKKKAYVQEGLKVVWVRNSTIIEADVDSEGYARTKDLDGTFIVNLKGLDKEYTYDPNIYKTNYNNRSVEILVFSPKAYTGSQRNSISDSFTVGQPRYYRAQIDYDYALSKGKGAMFVLTLQAKDYGTFEIESIVSTIDNDVNPMIMEWNGAGAAWFPNKDKGYLDTGGEGQASYTKNFLYEFKAKKGDLKIVGFEIFAESKTATKDNIKEKYPIYVDFKITKVSDIDPTEYGTSSVITADADQLAIARKAREIDTTGKELHVITGAKADKTSIINGAKRIYSYNIKKSEIDGMYHYVSDPKTTTPLEELPIVCVYITKMSPLIDGMSLNALDESAGGDTGKPYSVDVSIKDENGNDKVISCDYKNLIKAEYASVCNADGVCYATDQLVEFLQKYCDKWHVFFDGAGLVENTCGVEASSDIMWAAFACYYDIAA